MKPATYVAMMYQCISNSQALHQCIMLAYGRHDACIIRTKGNNALHDLNCQNSNTLEVKLLYRITSIHDLT